MLQIGQQVKVKSYAEMEKAHKAFQKLYAPSAFLSLYESGEVAEHLLGEFVIIRKIIAVTHPKRPEEYQFQYLINESTLTFASCEFEQGTPYD